MRHTISAHAGLPREESYSLLSEVVLSQKKLFAQCPRSRTAQGPHQAGFTQCQGHCAGSAGVRKTAPPFPPLQIRHGARAEQHSHPASVTLPLQQCVHWWFLQKGHTVLGTAVLGKSLLFLAILPSYTLGWEPGCRDPAILGPQTQRGL